MLDEELAQLLLSIQKRRLNCLTSDDDRLEDIDTLIGYGFVESAGSEAIGHNLRVTRTGVAQLEQLGLLPWYCKWEKGWARVIAVAGVLIGIVLVITRFLPLK